MNPDNPKLRCLKGLPLAIAAQRRLFYELETLCAIKAIWVDRPMPDTTQAAMQVALLLGLSEKQVHRRITALQQCGWLTTYNRQGHDAISWEKLAEQYKIKHYNFYYIPVPDPETTTVRKILISKAKQEKISQCERAARMRIKCNDQLREVIEEVAGTSRYGLDAVAHYQLLNFAYEGVLYEDYQQYALSTHYTDKEQKVFRGDTAMNYCTWSNLFGYKSRGGYAKLKRSLQADALITVEHRIQELPGHTTRNSRNNSKNDRAGFVRYDKASGTLQLIQADKITVLPLTGLAQRKAHQVEQQKGAIASGPSSIISERVRRSWIKRKIKQHEQKTM